MKNAETKDLAERVGRDLQDMGTIFFFDLIKQRVDKAISIAKKVGVRGMDAIIVQVAEENNSTLLSLDAEMLDKVKGIVKVKIGDVEKFI